MQRYYSTFKRYYFCRQSISMLKKNLQSFSLIEMMIFIVILSIFFIMAASVVTFTLRNMKFNESKIKATHYSNQLEEWLRTQKEIDWGGELCNGCVNPSNFTQSATGQGNSGDNYQTTYCFNSTPISGWQDLGQCADYTLNSIFKREVVFTSQFISGYVNQINVSITISWKDLGDDRSISTNTVFTVLEQP